MDGFDIIPYTEENGKSPVMDFVEKQSDKMQAKILRTFDLLKENGYELGGKYTKYLSDGILELRIKVASDDTRVLYFFQTENRIILTNGFVKKTQKTPPKEIELAKKYRTDYLRREGK